MCYLNMFILVKESFNNNKYYKLLCLFDNNKNMSNLLYNII